MQFFGFHVIPEPPEKYSVRCLRTIIKEVWSFTLGIKIRFGFAYKDPPWE